ncbi:MAG: Dabb family protein [Acidobacteriota bacterium]|nr:Dabb family protein [Acidobacteriota bacterium]
MIKRIVAIKLKDAYTASTDRAAVATHSRQVLAEVPGVRSIEVGLPGDPRTESSWDLILLLRFDDIDAVEAYRAHPIHRKYVDVFLRPMLEVIKVWNFDLQSEAPE